MSRTVHQSLSRAFGTSLPDGFEKELYFSSVMSTTGTISHSIPERACDRRMYRAFRAERFLEIKIPTNAPREAVLDICSRPYRYGSRTYRLLWCKKDKSPQRFV